MRLVASYALIVVLFLAAPLSAAERLRYVLQVAAPSVAERLEMGGHLARQYGASVVATDPVSGETTVEMSAAEAEVLATDRRVASVTAALAQPVPNSTTSITLGPYVYDGSGNIRKIGNDVYRYDALSRLTSATVAGGTRSQTYEYDGYGNLWKIQTAGAVRRELPIDPATNRIGTPTSTSTVTATYDAAGNETRINNGPLRSYDALRMMTANGADAVYVYTADDERIAVTNPSRTSWQWTLRGMDQKPLRELKETVTGSSRQWTWVRDYVYGDGTLVAAYVNHATPARTLQHYHLDHLGTPRLITDGNGVEITRDELFPFGEDPQFNVGDPERLHFTGHERDYAGGTSIANADYLDYMHARYYSPTLGRFLSVDPTWASADLGNPQSWNRYIYVQDNPIGRVDPTGKCGGLPGLDLIPCSLQNAFVAWSVTKLPTLPARFFWNSGVGQQIHGEMTGNKQEVAYGQMQAAHEVVTMAMLSYIEMGGGAGGGAAADEVISAEVIGTSIGRQVARQATGKMATIAGEISGLGMSQAGAARAVDSAVRATGLRTTGVVKVGNNLVVGSVQVGSNKRILVVTPQGVVRQATATIEVTRTDMVIKDISYQ